jgi:hypothetical protein
MEVGVANRSSRWFCCNNRGSRVAMPIVTRHEHVTYTNAGGVFVGLSKIEFGMLN